MSVLIVYVSGRGWVSNCMEKLADSIKQEVRLVNLKKRGASNPDPKNFDTVFIAGSVRMGRIPGILIRYTKKYEEVLGTRKLGFLISCLEEKELGSYLSKAFPRVLLDSSSVRMWTGGRIDLSEYNPLMRKMLKPMMKEDVVSLDAGGNLASLADKINNGAL